MAYTVPHKAIEMAHELADKMKLRFASKVVTESFDTDGLPLITINDGTPATTEVNIVIKIAMYNWPLAKDVLGNAANIYAPLVCQIATETDSASNYLGVNVLALIGELALRGLGIDWYKSANGTVPTASTFATATNLVASFSPDLYNRLTSQQ
jgi:hypothetical protein